MLSMLPYPSVIALLLCVTVSRVSGHESQPRSLNDLTGHWQLFIDDHLIEHRDNVVRTYHPFTKHAANPILVTDNPWEGLVYLYGTVLPTEDGTGYRMWYQSLARKPKISTVLYATSDDGIRWHKPALGIRAPDTVSDNNMFVARSHDDGIASIIHTPWDPDPARRYKIMNFDRGGFWGATSPDAVHLTDLPNNPVFTKGGDVGQFLWEPHGRQYLGYVKRVYDVSGMRRRCVGRIATDAIDSWPEPELVLAPDTFDDRWATGIQRMHFYGLSAFAYESMYLGFLWIFRATDDEGYFIGPVFAEIVSSDDGIHWTREQGERPPMLDLGLPGTWDCGQLYTATQPLLVGDTLRLYFGAVGPEVWRQALRENRKGSSRSQLVARQSHRCDSNVQELDRHVLSAQHRFAWAR